MHLASLGAMATRSPRPVGGCFAVAAIVGFAVLSLASDAGAGSALVVVSVDAAVPIRVQIALSPQGALPCDSSDNTMVFDGMVEPRAGIALKVDAGTLCVRHTYDDFPESNWGRSELWIRRFDAPLRIRLQARAP